MIAVLISTAVNAQSTTGRFGSGATNQDNTGRVLTYKKVSLTDATGADSTIAKPNAFETYYNVAMTDSFTFKQPVVTTSYYGDHIVIVASGASGTKVKFTGSLWVTAGVATLSTGGRAILVYLFDGAKYVEESRVVQ